MNPFSTDYPRTRKLTDAVGRAKKFLRQRGMIVWGCLLLLCSVLVWQQIALRHAQQGRAAAQQAAGDALYTQWMRARETIATILNAQEEQRPNDLNRRVSFLYGAFDTIETLGQIYNTTVTGEVDETNRLTNLFRIYASDVVGISNMHPDDGTLLDADEVAALRVMQHDLEQVCAIFDQASLARLDQHALDQKLERLRGAVESDRVREFLR